MALINIYSKKIKRARLTWYSVYGESEIGDNTRFAKQHYASVLFVFLNVWLVTSATSKFVKIGISACCGNLYFIT